MLDIKRIRSNPDEVKNALNKRHGDYPIDKVLEIDKERRNILAEMEEMKAKQNSVSKQIPVLKKEGKDVSGVLEEMKELSEK
jgi:Seryl-tRNA synthetase